MTLRRSSPLRAKKPMKKRNPKRNARLFAEDFHSDEYVKHIRSLPCANCEMEGYSVAAHVRSRGAGGKASDLVPLCRTRWGITGCHELYDEAKLNSRSKIRLRLAAVAASLWLARTAEGAA